MVRFLRRFFTSKTPRNARLFAGFSARGARMSHKVRTDKDFIKDFKVLVGKAGLPAAKMKRVTNHSFRAGGATDNFVAGVSAEVIKAQGGWTTYCFLIYCRPTAEHKWRVAATLMAAMRLARRPARSDFE